MEDQVRNGNYQDNVCETLLDDFISSYKKSSVEDKNGLYVNFGKLYRENAILPEYFEQVDNTNTYVQKRDCGKYKALSREHKEILEANPDKFTQSIFIGDVSIFNGENVPQIQNSLVVCSVNEGEGNCEISGNETQISKSIILNSHITNSTIKYSECNDKAKIQGSTITYSECGDETKVYDSTITYSECADNVTIKNSIVEHSKCDNNTVIQNSTTEYSTCSNNTTIQNSLVQISHIGSDNTVESSEIVYLDLNSLERDSISKGITNSIVDIMHKDCDGVLIKRTDIIDTAIYTDPRNPKSSVISTDIDKYKRQRPQILEGQVETLNNGIDELRSRWQETNDKEERKKINEQQTSMQCQLKCLQRKQKILERRQREEELRRNPQQAQRPNELVNVARVNHRNNGQNLG